MDSIKEEHSYKSILKGTSIFGGVQLVQILIGLLRGKFVALFLGPQGMGISSIFAASTTTLTQVSSLGLNLAYVKEVAEHKENPNRLGMMVSVAMRLTMLTALAGAMICALLAPWLSELSFGNRDYAWQFVALSVMVYLTVDASGKMSVLQGLHKVKIISVSTLIGAVTGLVGGVPLYYFFGDAGIVPAMILFALCNYICSSIGMRRAVVRPKMRITLREHGSVMKRLLKMGVILLASMLINSACTYGINIFIRVFGNLEDVGLFNAANSLTNQYAAVVFTAMLLDYFPRLTAIASDNAAMYGLVNKQLEIVSLIIGPAIVALIIVAPIAIRILLTAEFIEVLPLMRWMALGVMLKAIAYPTGYIAFAKNNQRLFFWLEAVACNAIYAGCAVGFYYFFGLIGMGYGMVVENAMCIVLYLVVNYKVYGYMYSRRTALYVLMAIAFGAMAFAVAFLVEDALLCYLLMGLIFVASAAISLKTLRSLVSERRKS